VDCARAWVHHTTAAARITAPVPIADRPVRRVMSHPFGAEITGFQEAWPRFPIA
jgi:hypothetical protein